MFDVYQRVKGSIVSIIAHIHNDVYIIGTGFIVSNCGHIVTSAHNILKNRLIGNSEYSTNISVCYDLTQIINASVVGIDKRADVCVLKINIKAQRYLKFSNTMKLGDKCYIFGCMEDYGIHSFHEGYIERINFVSDEVVDSLITNMKIIKGVSGSPILNSAGFVIGISNWYSEKTCGGVSSTLLKNIVQKIIYRRKQYKKGFVGFKCRPLLAQDIVHYNIPFLKQDIHGMMVTQVYTSVLSDNEIKKNDIISSVDNIKVGIRTYSLEWFTYMKEPGDFLSICYHKYLGNNCWENSISSAIVTLIEYPNSIDIPLSSSRGRINIQS